jgi:glycosyltransferase involved in cell wall biosynthesis
VSRSLLQRGLDLGVPREYLHLVPNGIDHSVFRITRPIADRAPCIALLAHEPPVKGLPDAIETVRLVRERRPDTEVIAFGGGPRPAILPSGITYQQQPVGRELAEQVYNRASVFLCTSLSEGFGFPSLEAMACGAALVSTANGGVDEFARHGESALICPVGDTAALADSVLALLSDDALRVAVAQQGVRSAARFSWEASGDAFHATVRAALEHDRGAA